MRKISLTLILLLFVFYSCNSTDQIIKNTEVEYLQSRDITIIHEALIDNPIEIHGKWNKTNYEEEFRYRQKDYFIYLKDDKNIVGIFVKPNKIKVNFIDKRKYFANSLIKEINQIDDVGLKYELIKSDEESYQIYKFRGIDNIQFYGLIGIKNKKICYLSVYNNNLNEEEKEDLLIKLFLDMNT
jgi:hypothetical protein